MIEVENGGTFSMVYRFSFRIKYSVQLVYFYLTCLAVLAENAMGNLTLPPT